MLSGALFILARAYEGDVDAQPPEGPVESDAALEAYLRSAPYEYIRPLPGGGGHQEKMILVLRGGVAVAAKPGHDDNYAQQAKCEVGAYLLALELGLTKLVPTTVLRPMPGPHGEVEGSAQVLWPQFVVAQGRFTNTDCSDELGWQIAVFDCLAANTDRHDGNWGAITNLPDAVLVDHGHCFTKAPVTTSPFVLHRRDREIPEPMMAAVEGFLNNAENTRLREVLPADIVDQVIDRARQLVQEKRLTVP